MQNFWQNREIKVFSAKYANVSRKVIKVIYIFGHVLTEVSRCYGRCHVKKLLPLCTFRRFHTQEETPVRSFLNVFDKSSMVEYCAEKVLQEIILDNALFWNWYLLGVKKKLSQIHKAGSS